MNGLPCRECGGSSRLRARRGRDWRALLRSRPALAAMGAAATAAGTVLGWYRSLPGICGAAGVSYGLAAVTHGLVPRVPELAAGLLTAGVFGLMMDRRL